MGLQKHGHDHQCSAQDRQGLKSELASHPLQVNDDHCTLLWPYNQGGRGQVAGTKPQLLESLIGHLLGGKKSTNV